MSLSDEEQFDSLKSFAKKYGSAMISGILIALIAFFGWEYWQKRNLATSQTETAKVQQLMDEANATADNPNALASITASADKIVKTVKATGAIVSGPIPLPTDKKIFTVNRSTFVNKKAREQFELNSFRRLLDIYSSTPKTVDALMKLELPSGVEVEIKV